MDVCIISSNILCIYNIFLSVFVSFHKKKNTKEEEKCIELSQSTIRMTIINMDLLYRWYWYM